MKYLACYCLIALLLLGSGSAVAGIYMYVDSQGIHHYSNVPVDSRYRPIRLSESGLRRQVEKNREHRHQPPRQRKKVVSGTVASFEHHIQRAARHNNIDPALVKAIIKAESDFDPLAISAAGAQGLMQLMPETAREMEVRDPFDARENIFGGTRYLRELLDAYNGNLTLSLAAYNAGPSRVVGGQVPPIRETRQYIKRVLHWYRNYQIGHGYLTSINVHDLKMVN